MKIQQKDYNDNSKKIYVTQPYLPPVDEFLPYLENIWENKILTNGGPYHESLEKALCEYLGVQHISLFTNGTIALVTALQALGITGEVITTPYSFVATAHSLLWNGIQPVFVDIDPKTLNIDPKHIENHISANTTAIMPVHCYGQPCDVDKIQEIANRNNLKVIYDAAHAFDVSQLNGNNILNYGNLSVLSFHATKVFNTFEGGAIISPDAETKQHIDRLKNFGFADEVTVIAAGINGKMSEINAAFGLLQLKHMQSIISRRKEITEIYSTALKNIVGIRILLDYENWIGNYSYFPILVNEDFPINRDDLYKKFTEKHIYVRRYFYPLISEFPMYKTMPSAHRDNLPIAFDAASKVLCLPIYPALSNKDLDLILKIIREI
jgi:dTDP-4-amino-4,6-dideoxygalactose transaminase